MHSNHEAKPSFATGSIILSENSQPNNQIQHCACLIKESSKLLAFEDMGNVSDNLISNSSRFHRTRVFSMQAAKVNVKVGTSYHIMVACVHTGIFCAEENTHVLLFPCVPFRSEPGMGEQARLPIKINDYVSSFHCHEPDRTGLDN